MQRNEQDTSKPATTDVQTETNAKPELIVPDFIEIAANGCIQYHYHSEETARTVHARLRAHENNLPDVKQVPITKPFLVKAEYVVAITPVLFDYLFGVGAYTKLCQLKLLNSAAKIGDVARLLAELEPVLVNQAALTLDLTDGFSGLMAAVYSSQRNKLDSYLHHLSAQTCNNAAVFTYSKDKWNVLMAMAKLCSRDIFLKYLRQVTPEQCLRAALQKNEDGNNTFDIVNSHQGIEVYQELLKHIGAALYTNTMLTPRADNDSPLRELLKNACPFVIDFFDSDILNAAMQWQNASGMNLLMWLLDRGDVHADNFPRLFARIADETLNQAVLQQDKNGRSLLMCILEKLPSASIQACLNRLTSATWRQAALQKINDGPGMLEMIARYKPDMFVSILDRIDAELCVKSALGLNGHTSSLVKIAQHVPEPAFLRLLEKIYQHPETVRQVFARVSYLLKIEFFDGGSSLDAWSELTKTLIDKAPPTRKRKERTDLSAQISVSKRQRPEWSVDFLNHTEKHGLTFLRLQGRTILLKDAQDMMLAVKIQKKDETREELTKEFDTTLYLREHAAELCLQSALPQPLSLSSVTNVIDWLKPRVSADELAAFCRMTGDARMRSAYIYKVNPRECDYFTYLHDPVLSDDAYYEANRKAVHDLYTLLAHGMVFTQLGDIFHNSEHVNDRDDKGRYIVMVNLLRGGSGSGRLTGWREAVIFPNLRNSGLADLGDRLSINDFIGQTERVRAYYSTAWSTYRDKTGNYLLANIMAEYQYILMLIAGRRGCELTERAKNADNQSAAESIEKIHAIWLKLAKQLVTNCAQAVSVLTHEPEHQAESFLLSVIDVDMLARQMRYWMMGEYIPDLLQNRVQKGIYADQVQISVDISRFRSGTFNDKTGCAIDGVHPDLGAVNGQEPLKIPNELFHWMVNSVYRHFHQVRLTLTDLAKVTKEKDLTASEKLRAEAFTHLAEKPYHALQAALCAERLKQAQVLPDDMKEKLASERDSHKRKHAALTIGSFWRSRKKTAISVPVLAEIAKPS